MSRRLWIVPAVIVFLAISFELARYLTAAGTERSAVSALLRDQARGDANGMLERLDGCRADAACVAQVRRNAARLTAKFAPKILLLESHSAYSLTTSTGLTRVAWADVKGNGTTHVQCITVRKKWTLIGGADVTLSRIGPQIGNEDPC